MVCSTIYFSECSIILTGVNYLYKVTHFIYSYLLSSCRYASLQYIYSSHNFLIRILIYSNPFYQFQHSRTTLYLYIDVDRILIAPHLSTSTLSPSLYNSLPRSFSFPHSPPFSSHTLSSTFIHPSSFYPHANSSQFPPIIRVHIFHNTFDAVFCFRVSPN